MTRTIPPPSVPVTSMFTIWSQPQVTMTITTTPTAVAGPDIIIPASYLPAGAPITRVELLMKYRKVMDTSGLDNKLSGNLNVQVKESVAGTFTTGISLKDDMMLVAADGESGGDMLVGAADVKAEVAADDKTYNTQIALAVSDGNNLILKDIQFGVRFYIRVL